MTQDRNDTMKNFCRVIINFLVEGGKARDQGFAGEQNGRKTSTEPSIVN